MRRTRSSIQLLALALVASSLLACWDDFSSPTAPEDPGSSSSSRVLPVSFVPQQTGVWCWAAVSEMVLRYYGVGVFQCQILSGWAQTDCCNFPGFCLTTASIPVIRQTLAFYGVGSTYAAGPLTFAQVAAEIDARRPIIIAYRGYARTGHVVVLYGYDADGFVYIHDPLYGTFRRVPFGSSFTYNGQLFWSETIFGIG